jgi:hypothetical protein
MVSVFLALISKPPRWKATAKAITTSVHLILIVNIFLYFSLNIVLAF